MVRRKLFKTKNKKSQSRAITLTLICFKYVRHGTKATPYFCRKLSYFILFFISYSEIYFNAICTISFLITALI